MEIIFIKKSPLPFAKEGYLIHFKFPLPYHGNGDAYN
jgi:hypothetical protein